MIDTDKYEGHTPAPWKAENKCYRNGVDENNLGQVDSFQRTWGVTLSEEKLSDNRENRIGYDVMHISDAKLIADAPVILAEYMKLREENQKQLLVLSTLGGMIQRGSEHVELMKALGQGLGVTEAWKGMKK